MSHCAACVWSYRGGPGQPRLRCRRSDALIGAFDPACPGFEAALSCQTCGACCGPAFDCVDVEPDEPLVRHPQAGLVTRFSVLQLPRPGGDCVHLRRSGSACHCAMYALRPRSCREFKRGSAVCLDARQRLGFDPQGAKQWDHSSSSR